MNGIPYREAATGLLVAGLTANLLGRHWIGMALTTVGLACFVVQIARGE